MGKDYELKGNEIMEKRICIRCGRGTPEVKSWTVGLVPVGQNLCGECAGHFKKHPTKVTKTADFVKGISSTSVTDEFYGEG